MDKSKAVEYYVSPGIYNRAHIYNIYYAKVVQCEHSGCNYVTGNVSAISVIQIRVAYPKLESGSCCFRQSNPSRG